MLKLMIILLFQEYIILVCLNFQINIHYLLQSKAFPYSLHINETKNVLKIHKGQNFSKKKLFSSYFLIYSLHYLNLLIKSVKYRLTLPDNSSRSRFFFLSSGKCKTIIHVSLNQHYSLQLQIISHKTQIQNSKHII